VRVGPKIIKLHPQLISFVMITMVLFGALAAVDAVGVKKFPEFVTDEKIDLIIKVTSWEYSSYLMSSNKILLDVEKVLNGTYYVMDYVTFMQVRTELYYFKNVSDEQLQYVSFYGNIICLNDKLIDWLNINITSGSLRKNSILIRYDLLVMHGLEINKSKVSYYMGYSTFYNLTVSGTFTINETNFGSDVIGIASEETIMRIASLGEFWEFSKVFLVDINASFIDKVNPERSLSEMNTLSQKIWNVEQKYFSANIYIPVDFILAEKVSRFVEWKANYRSMLLVSLLPLLISFWVLQYFFIETFFAKWEREINIIMARGYRKDVKIGMLLSFVFFQTILGFLIGLPAGAIFSRVYIFPTISAINFYDPPIVVSLVSYTYITIYYAVTIFIALLLYGIVAVFNSYVKKAIKRKKGILRKIFILFQGTYLDAVFIIYSILIFLLFHISSETIFTIVRYSFFPPIFVFLIIFLFAPFAFVIGITRIILRYSKTLLIMVTQKMRDYSSLRSLILGIRNVFREDTKNKILATIFSMVILVNVSSTIINYSYVPYIVSHEKWFTGSDLGIYFRSEANVTRINEIRVAILKNITGIESSTIIFATEWHSYAGGWYYSYSYYIFGISSESFLKTVYGEDGKLLINSSIAEKIFQIKNGSRVALVSKSLSEELDISPETTLRFTNFYTNELISIKVKDEISEKISPLFIAGMYMPCYEIVSAEEIENHIEWIIEWMEPISNYMITDIETCSKIDNSVSTSILIKINDHVNKTAVAEAIEKRINELKYNYTELICSYTRFFKDNLNKMLGEERQISVMNALYVSYVFSAFLVIIAILEFMTILYKKRPRELAVLLAIGEDRRKIAEVVFIELFALLIYGIIVGYIVAYPSSIIFSLIVGLSPEFMTRYVYTFDMYLYPMFSILVFIAFAIASILIILWSIMKMDVTKYLKIEWVPEKFLAEIEVERYERT